jgi:hypothetical protein
LQLYNYIKDKKAVANPPIKDLLVTCICAYKAESTMIKLELETFKDPNFEALVAKVTQGIGRDVIVLTIPNAKSFTKFVTERRRLLVELSRHKIALLLIMAKEALTYKSYNLRDEHDLLKSEFGLLKSLFDFAMLEHVTLEVKTTEI